ncbi:hypothetical protein H7J93_22580 [Mycobacterium barrassiae]|uniref:hypothetical protein n=1 Tax=Mycobacterium barrassiae TaxID=319709 RepID=UPI002265C470|nr:hypothetical protein [Mycobacterium barrassiae]MCV7302415.1 hypothetical protein [Mycobacterium barrassiae]
MAETYDAGSRLAEGQPATETVQDYVWACHLVGYQDADLTLHASQVRDWYGSEDGIDLRALDADCEALRSAATAVEGVLARQEAQLVLMPVVWRGQGARASREFLRRHGETSATVVSAVRTAVESLTSLRDRLWRSIDGKVAAAVAVESRAANPDWRAAVQTVTTGAGDRATASELVELEVKPFVENDIRGEWLTAMRSAVAAVTDAYDAAVAELTSQSAVAFEVPGDFGPAWSGPTDDAVGTAPAGVNSSGGGGMSLPLGASTPWSTPPVAQSPLPGPPPPPLPTPPATPPVEPAAMAPSSMPSLGGGMPDIGSGLSGFGGQLADLLGGLLGTSSSEQDALADLPEVDEPDELDNPEELDEPDDEGELDEEIVDDEESADAAEADPAAVDEEAAAERPADPPPPAATETPIEPPPPISAVPPPIEPLAAPSDSAGTPCEIAADELPQVGE